MCRWFIYKGPKTKLKPILWLPENSLLKQTFKAPYTPFLNPSDRNHEVNVDGFGIGWYHSRSQPYLYKNTIPPWNDLNLLNLSDYISTRFLFAHIRAIKPFGPHSPVHQLNSHPFSCYNFMWMHNGECRDPLPLVKYLYTAGNVPDHLLEQLQGNTDSEYCFILFLSHLPKKYQTGGVVPYSVLKQAMQDTLKTLSILMPEAYSYNFAFTDGKSIIAIRYLDSRSDSPPSLYYSVGSRYQFHDQHFQMMSDSNSRQCIIISSEPINSNPQEWKLIAKNRMIVVSCQNNIKIHKLPYSSLEKNLK